MWPFRSMIMRGGAAAAARASAAAQGSRDAAAASAPGVPQEPLFHFGDATMQRQALDMTNRLTGCATNGGTKGLCFTHVEAQTAAELLAQDGTNSLARANDVIRASKLFLCCLHATHVLVQREIYP